MRPRANTSPGFTLIEVVISSALMALILTSAYVCLSAALSAQRLVEPRAEIIQTGRVVTELIAADLRCACPLSKETMFLGAQRMLGKVEGDNLDFGTHNYTPRKDGEGDFCQESIYLNPDAKDGNFKLLRRRNPRIGLNSLSGGITEELAKGVVGLRFEYFDGLDWYTSWGEAPGTEKPRNSRRVRTNLDGMPDAVRITLWLASNPKAKPSTDEKAAVEPPMVFQTVARLALAKNVMNSALSGSSATDSAPDQQAQPQGGVQ